MTNPDIETAVQIEAARVRAMLAEAVQQIEAEGSNIRAFAAALLTGAVQLHAEIEGTEGLARAITSLGQRELLREGRAGRA